MLRLTVLAAGAWLLATLAQPASAATLITYGDAASFNSATGALSTEDFSDAALVEGLAIAGQSLSYVNGKLRQTLNPAGAPTATFTFADPIGAFGGYYDFTVGGVGQKFDVIVSFLDPQLAAVNLGVPDRGSGFFGFTSPHAIRQVVFQAKGGAESYWFDDLSFGAYAPISGVPEPGAWAMLIIGFFSLGSALRGRRQGLLTA